MSSQPPAGHKPSLHSQEEGGQPATSKDDNSPKTKIMRFVNKKLQSRKQIRLAALIGISLAIVVIIVLVVAIYFSTSSSSSTDDSATAPVSSESVGGHRSENMETRVSPPASTGSSSVSIYNLTSTQKLTTSRKTASSTKLPLTPTTRTTTQDNSPPTVSSVHMNDVVLSMDNNSLSLSCTARHLGSWKTLTIKRIFGDALEPVVVAVNENGKPTVHVLHYNASHEITRTTFGIVLSTKIDSFSCNDVSNYSCVLDTGAGLVTDDASVAFDLPKPPTITVPHVVVEDREVMLHCSVDTISSGVAIQWQFRTAGMDSFLDFGGSPVVERTDRNCTTTINSNLTFSPSLYENGSDFRCLVQGVPEHVRQINHVDTKILVVQKNFCEGKRQFTVHPHPYNPCSLVIYCLESGPLVYEIECEPGQCYDTKKTTCVSANGS